MIRTSHVKFIYRTFLSALSQSAVQETANNRQLLCMDGFENSEQSASWNYAEGNNI